MGVAVGASAYDQAGFAEGVGGPVRALVTSRVSLTRQTPIPRVPPRGRGLSAEAAEVD